MGSERKKESRVLVGTRSSLSLSGWQPSHSASVGRREQPAVLFPPPAPMPTTQQRNNRTKQQHQLEARKKTMIPFVPPNTGKTLGKHLPLKLSRVIYLSLPGYGPASALAGKKMPALRSALVFIGSSSLQAVVTKDCRLSRWHVQGSLSHSRSCKHLSPGDD